MYIYARDDDRSAGKFVALSPAIFVERSGEVFADLPAVIHGARRYDWAQAREHSVRLTAVLRELGVGRNDTRCAS